jgi:DNA invertase Pin-like site-specific DNA recombinase
VSRVPVCYGYGRHSTNKQELTQEVQEHRCHQYWERTLKERGVVWGGFYYDKATSAKVPFTERPQGREVYVLAQPTDHIVVSKMDRAFRSLRDGIVSMEMFASKGVAFHSMDLQVDTSTPLGRFFRSVLLAVAELEREFVSERVKETIALRKREGRPHGRSCPIGWRIVGQKPNRSYRSDPEERALADLIAAKRKSGMSHDAIALWCLRQQDLPCKRRFTTRDAVHWVLLARRAGYPKITNYKEFRQAVRSGHVSLGPA